ncbi:MAG TPA: hypothetical protein VKW06_09160 [Candidatus Angelobacter sp.]|nr:hypothetical protein [Candidatus Angelobacter sp.]
MSFIKKVGICAALLLFVTAYAAPATNSEQIVFSKTGGLMPLVGNSNASSTPFGFWIWCNGEAASNSNGGYQAANACQGEMYFYALQVNAQHVVGQAVEVSPGVYTMHVVQGTAAQLFSGTLNPAFSCSLTNVTPGGGDSVAVHCIFFSPLGGGMGSATTTGTIVNITGP